MGERPQTIFTNQDTPTKPSKMLTKFTITVAAATALHAPFGAGPSRDAEANAEVVETAKQPDTHEEQRDPNALRSRQFDMFVSTSSAVMPIGNTLNSLPFPNARRATVGLFEMSGSPIVLLNNTNKVDLG